MHFIECKYKNFHQNLTEVCYQRFNWQYSSIGSGDNDNQRMYTSLGLNDLMDAWNQFVICFMVSPFHQVHFHKNIKRFHGDLIKQPRELFHNQI